VAKKKTNERCPLQAECERKCSHEGNEIECDYYFGNARPGYEIEDQEVLRSTTPDDELFEDEPMPGQLTYISVDKLHPHPYNPRKDVGDVSELADSIKVNGVLQNLTVVPMELVDPDATVKLGEGNYTVIIGHRRLAAAKLAGIEKVPCSIVEMSEKEQIGTMLTENMQRSDLTVYEQAQGFQMMLDLGESVENVAEQTGFSTSTVRRRVKLLELDQDKFKKAVKRGATLFDFAQLDDIEDPEVKNSLLDSIGKADFKNDIKRELEKQKDRKKLRHYAEEVSKWATSADKADWSQSRRVAVVGDDTIEVDYVRNYSTYGSATVVVEKPADADERRYFFTKGSYSVDVYGEVTDAMRAKKEAKDAERQEKRDREKAIENEFRTVTARHYQLRRDFILNFNQFKKKSAEVAEFVSDTMVMLGLESYYSSGDIETLSGLLGIPLNESEDGLAYHEFLQIKKEQPERTMLIIAFWLRDSDDEGFWTSKWDPNLGAYCQVFCENEALDETYRLLTYLGYEMSTEESEMRNGTHKLFDKAGDVYKAGASNE